MAGTVKNYFVLFRYVSDGTYGIESNRDIVELRSKNFDQAKRGQKITALLNTKSHATTFEGEFIKADVNKPLLLELLKQREAHERIKGKTLRADEDPEILPRKVLAKKRVSEESDHGDEDKEDSAELVAKKARAEEKAKEKSIAKKIAVEKANETIALIQQAKQESEHRLKVTGNSKNTPQSPKTKVPTPSKAKPVNAKEETATVVTPNKGVAGKKKESSGGAAMGEQESVKSPSRKADTNAPPNCESCPKLKDDLKKRERDVKHYKNKSVNLQNEVDELKKKIVEREKSLVAVSTDRDLEKKKRCETESQILKVEAKLAESIDLKETLRTLKLLVFELTGVVLPGVAKVEEKEEFRSPSKAPVINPKVSKASPKKWKSPLKGAGEILKELSNNRDFNIPEDMHGVGDDDEEYAESGPDLPMTLEDSQEKVAENFVISSTKSKASPDSKNEEHGRDKKTNESTEGQVFKEASETTARKSAAVDTIEKPGNDAGKSAELKDQLNFKEGDPWVTRLSVRYCIYGEEDVIKAAKSGGVSPMSLMRKLIEHLVKPEYFRCTARGQAGKGGRGGGEQSGAGALHADILSYSKGVVKEVATESAKRKDPKWNLTDAQLNNAFAQALVLVRRNKKLVGEPKVEIKIEGE